MKLRGEDSGGAKLLGNPGRQQLRIAHAFGLRETMNSRGLLGIEAKPHSRPVTPVEDGMADFFEFVLEFRHVAAVPKLRQVFNGIRLRNFAHRFFH